MRTSGLFTTHSCVIPAKSSKEIQLLFVGDIHRDSPNHAAVEWQSFLKYARSLPNAYLLLMGDYLDSTSTSERGMLGHITDQMHETFVYDLEALQSEKIKLIAKELMPFRNRIIGAINGNHYFNFQDGTNSDQKLCGLLGCRYLGCSAFVRLYFQATKTARLSLDVWCHHGAGAGRLIGSSLNRVQQMADHAIADVYAMGDDHARAIAPGQPRFALEHSPRGGLEMKTRNPWLVRSGSFLKGYVENRRSYVVDSARGPRSIGHVELRITPRASSGDYWLELHGVN